jgi:hypothetical protein
LPGTGTFAFCQPLSFFVSLSVSSSHFQFEPPQNNTRACVRVVNGVKNGWVTTLFVVWWVVGNPSSEANADSPEFIGGCFNFIFG